MKSRITGIAVLVTLVVAINAAGAGSVPPPRAPANFFGIAPQTVLTSKDVEYMKAGGIGAIRVSFDWAAIQPTKRSAYDWTSTDQSVALAARNGLEVLPYLYNTPRWLARKPTTLPIDTGKQKRAWRNFVRAAVERYGPEGEFWTEHSAVINYEPAIPEIPIKSWQVWNEANFFYFAYPVSPQRYATLLKLTTPVIRAAQPGAKVILTGLFGDPSPGLPKGMTAVEFLETLYAIPGTRSYFDGIALHPYAVDAETLEELVEEFHEVTVENHDRVPMYITEMGWGSQNDYNVVAFEQGIQGQVKQLRDSYGYLLANRTRLDLKQVYWYSWKDNPEYVACSFCDSVGLFQAGPKFKPKPSWRAFVSLTHGRARP